MRLPFRAAAMHGLCLQRSRLYLRPPRQSDWPAWAEQREASRAFLVPWEPTWGSDALTRAAYRRRIKSYDLEWEKGSSHSFFILRSRDDELLGGITISNVRRGVAQSASLGYWIGACHAHQGYMTEALSAVLDFAFAHLGLHRVEAACLPDNAASQGLLLKIGFHDEGYARQYLRINGRWQDHRLFALLKSDKRFQP